MSDNLNTLKLPYYGYIHVNGALIVKRFFIVDPTSSASIYEAYKALKIDMRSDFVKIYLGWNYFNSTQDAILYFQDLMIKLDNVDIPKIKFL